MSVMYVCKYVCMYVCMHVCMYARISVMYACMSVCLSACAWVLLLKRMPFTNRKQANKQTRTQPKGILCAEHLFPLNHQKSVFSVSLSKRFSNEMEFTLRKPVGRPQSPWSLVFVLQGREVHRTRPMKGGANIPGF